MPGKPSSKKTTKIRFVATDVYLEKKNKPLL